MGLVKKFFWVFLQDVRENDTQIIKRKEYKHNTRESHGITREEKAKKKGAENKDNQQTVNRTAGSTYLSIITSNVNGLNAPIRRHRVAEQIQTQDPYICCIQEIHVRPRDTYRLKVQVWKKIFHANGNQKQYSYQTDFKIKTVTRDKKGHYRMIKGSIQEEDTTIINTYASNIGAPQYIR